MIEGRLGYNDLNQRYGLLVSDLWENDGFHCGDALEVMIEGEWVATRIEMARDKNRDVWYLVNTPYHGDLEFVRARV